MIGLVVTILLYVIAAVPGFFAINDPYQQNGRAAYHPPQAIHFFDTDASGGRTLPALFPSRPADPRSGDAGRRLQAGREPQDRDHLLRRGLRVFGLRPVHHQAALLASSDPASRCFWSAPTGSAAVSGAASCRGRRSRSRSASSASSCRCIIGVVLGGISGYYGGRIDFAIQRVIEFVLAIPNIPIWLALSAAHAAQLAARPANIS